MSEKAKSSNTYCRVLIKPTFWHLSSQTDVRRKESLAQFAGELVQGLLLVAELEKERVVDGPNFEMEADDFDF